jgi:hypothetical protein
MLWPQAMLWHKALGQLKPLAGGHCCGFWVGHPMRVGQASTADGLHCRMGCVSVGQGANCVQIVAGVGGHPGPACVQNITVQSMPGETHGMWCVGQGANWVQTVAGVGGHPGPL